MSPNGADAAAELGPALVRLGVMPAGARPAFTRLTGGVSSDIWRVDLPTGPVCIKRALPKLRVAADWQAPVERNEYEAAWLRIAARAVPEAVPPLLGQDPQTGSLVMAYLPPESYPVWKEQLRQGQAGPGVATAVAERIARIHRATANDPAAAAGFPTDRIFYDIRLEPYLVATARRHPELADRLQALVAQTASTKRALVHGDVSPKNILVGPQGPVFLDAECAWYGDPAFDIAFCLNHLLLKCLWAPMATPLFLRCFRAMAEAYVAAVDWESPGALEDRAARLLPGLFLARVDGKSPVEYVTQENDRERVRRVARRLLIDSPSSLAQVLRAWGKELGVTEA